jgi:hypothetical protein
MEDLLNSLDLDPVASPIGIIAILIGLRFVLGAFKMVIKLLFLGLILIGAYLFFYGGQVT